MSRLVCGVPDLDVASKRVFIEQMRRQAAFSGVEILTFCIMRNHFHILVRVPPLTPEGITTDILVERYRLLYGQERGQPGRFSTAMNPCVLKAILERGGDEAEQIRQDLLARMHDISAYMRELKQRFSIWYNRRNERFGTLWSERFKSVLVEGSRSALKVVAAYIDLNPVRAGIVDDPKDYLWSGYGAACAGNRRSLFGLVSVMGGDSRRAQSLHRSIAAYRVMLYGKGAVPGPDGKSRCVDPDKARAVMRAGGILSMSEWLLCRSRSISHGIILGGYEFVLSLGEMRRQSLQCKRRCKPRCLPGGDDAALYAIR